MGNRKSCWWQCCMSWNAVCTRSRCAINKFIKGSILFRIFVCCSVFCIFFCYRSKRLCQLLCITVQMRCSVAGKISWWKVVSASHHVYDCSSAAWLSVDRDQLHLVSRTLVYSRVAFLPLPAISNQRHCVQVNVGDVWVGVVWAYVIIFVWLRGKICVGEWCCEVVGSCEVQLSCEVRCSASSQPDKNLYMCVCVCVCVWWSLLVCYFTSHFWEFCQIYNLRALVVKDELITFW